MLVQSYHWSSSMPSRSSLLLETTLSWDQHRPRGSSHFVHSSFQHRFLHSPMTFLALVIASIAWKRRIEHRKIPNLLARTRRLPGRAGRWLRRRSRYPHSQRACRTVIAWRLTPSRWSYKDQQITPNHDRIIHKSVLS